MRADRGDLASYGSRVGATLLDGVIVAVVAVIAAILAGGSGAEEDTTGYIVIGAALLSGLLYAPALMCRSGAHNGQTLGKQALKIRVVRQDAAAMTASTALLREFVGKALLGLIPFFTIVDYLFPLGDSRQQAIHDKLASTFVVRADAVPDSGALEPGAATADPFGGQGPERPPTTSGWQPPATATPEPAAAPPSWGPPTPTPTPAPPPERSAEDDAIRGPFGPSST